MPKLLNICILKKLMQEFPAQHYCFYKRLYKYILPTPNTYLRHCSNFSTLSSPQDITGIKQLANEFPDPKNIFAQLLNEVFLADQSLDIKPSISYEQMSFGTNNEFVWRATLNLKWPENFEVEGVANKKADAENIAFLHACQKFKELGVLDQTNKPLLAKDKLIPDSVKIAKGDLLNIFQRIWIRYGKKEYIPKFNPIPMQGIYGGSKYWKSELHITYPEKKVFEAASFRLKDAENIAAAKALLWLISQGVINKRRQLVQYTRDDEMKLRESHLAPYSICIPQPLQDKMHSVLSALQEQKSQLSTTSVSRNEDVDKDSEVANLFTDQVYNELESSTLLCRNLELYEKLNCLKNKSDPEFLEIQKAKSSLPIIQKREAILKMINENQVVVLSGETGCGKSTQVPQFILDQYIKQMKGGHCNIVVTQPRRISAVSLADRVAKERGERVGETVGYQIRLDRCMPSGNGTIFYCTTGIFLRKLYRNPNLEGISHVIVDEVHERNIQIDFLFILLQKLLERNKNIKLILMSASFNTQLFSKYFNSCPVINVPGKIYPVKEYFLEDLQNDMPNIRTSEPKIATLDTDLMVNVIEHINETQPPGAILCFLPGWRDIRTVHSKLLEDKNKSSKLFLCPVHSRLPLKQQKNIFVRPSDGQRKVILATNIAETSITVNDVVYVVNSGLHKGTYVDTEEGIASLAVQWITKANVRQRRGRAGRVQPGICYHLFSRKALMEMQEYPIPEILRIPLEKVIIDCKLYCPDVKAEDFLSKALQPPPTASIENGVNVLQALGVLDYNENLTELGKVVVRFTTHPRLSIALVYAAFLGCLDPVLTICAILSVEKEPFINTLDDKFQIKKIKQMHNNGLCSDHLALSKIYQTWESLDEVTDINEYIEKHLLDEQALERIKQMKELFAEDLSNAGILRNKRLYSDLKGAHNVHHAHTPSILAALTAAFFPNVVKIMQGEISHGKLKKDSLIYSLVKGQKAYIQKESVLSEEEELPSPWLVYFSAMKSEARRLAMISSLSSVPGTGLLLLAGKELSMKDQAEEDLKQLNSAVLQIEDYSELNFSCTEKEACLLLDWRKHCHNVLKLYMQNRNGEWNCEEKEYMLFCRSKILPIMKEILEIPQIPFGKGQMYEFVENNIIAKEL